MPTFGLIADDLTGALDAGAGFVRAGLRAVLPTSGHPADAPQADVLLLNTASREGDAAAARRAATEAARRLRLAGISRVYKKIDSALRGHPGPELAGVLDVYGGRAVVAPAFPAQGRTTVGGVQLIHGRPAPAHGGSLRQALAEVLERADLHDAAADDDLVRIAQRAAAEPDYRVWCGTAGLAAHVPLALGLVPAAPPSPGRSQTVPHRQPPTERLLVIAGSLHPATAAQTAALARAGWEHLSVPIDRPPPATLRADLARAMEQHRYVVLALHRGALSEGDVQELARQPGAAERALQPLVQAVQGASWLGPGLGLIVTGGETALQLCRSWGATSIEITGEALPGIPLGRLQLPQGSVPLATKSGGFGAPDALLETARALL